jgi:hypothetical protein
MSTPSGAEPVHEYATVCAADAAEFDCCAPAGEAPTDFVGAALGPLDPFDVFFEFNAVAMMTIRMRTTSPPPAMRSPRCFFLGCFGG